MARSLHDPRAVYESTFDFVCFESDWHTPLTHPERRHRVAPIESPREFPGLSQEERMRQVLRILETRDSVAVAELAEVFSVSEVTVRSDLTALARQGLVARVRGGVRALSQGQSEVGF